MPFDAVLLTAVTRELTPALTDARIDRVQQPQKDTVILSIRGRQGAGRLLLSASGNRPRVHLTQAAQENPAQPPMFCMLLRKHLTGAKILEVVQPHLERVFTLRLRCTDEMGQQTQKQLILEIMGRGSNLILTDGENRIIDCLRRVDFSQSQKRQILPGLYYQPPVPLEKRDPLAMEPETLEALLEQAPAMDLDKWLLQTFTGLSPLICRELAFRFRGRDNEDPADMSREERQALARHLAAEFSALEQGPFTPTLLLRGGAPFDFTYRPVGQYAGGVDQRSLPSFSQLLDVFYAQRDRDESMRQRSQTTTRLVTNLLARTRRKLAAQEKEREATLDRDRLRQLGDIVTANLHAIRRGQASLTVPDFYDPDMAPVTIPLSVTLSPQQNAAKFYKDYTKAKHAQTALTEQIAAGRREEAYLASVLDELERAETERDLTDIRQELMDGGYLRLTGDRKKMKTAPSRPMEFRSSDGFAIFVGRNNRQNDQLTGKQAMKSDLWLHTQKIHGSHVIISCGAKTPPQRTVEEAACLAALYSQGRNGQNVPVDCTLVKYVKKPAGAKPGMVIYDRYKTLYVTPDAALAKRLEKGAGK